MLSCCSACVSNCHSCAGLLQQAQQQLEVAKAACNVVRWQSPSVIFHLPLGVHPAVKAELNVRPMPFA